MGRYTAARLIGAFFALFGALFVVIGLVMSSVNSGMAQARTATTEATIVDVDVVTHTDSDGDRTTSYYPILEFEDSDHVPHRGRQGVSSGRYKVGEKVEIKYDPRDPEGNLLMSRDEGTAGLITTIFVAMGAIFAIIGIIVIIISFA